VTQCEHCGTFDVDMDVHLCAKRLLFEHRAFTQEAYAQMLEWRDRHLEMKATIYQLLHTFTQRCVKPLSVTGRVWFEAIKQLPDTPIRSSLLALNDAIEHMYNLGLDKLAHRWTSVLDKAYSHLKEQNQMINVRVDKRKWEHRPLAIWFSPGPDFDDNDEPCFNVYAVSLRLVDEKRAMDFEACGSGKTREEAMKNLRKAVYAERATGKYIYYPDYSR